MKGARGVAEDRLDAAGRNLHVQQLVGLRH